MQTRHTIVVAVAVCGCMALWLLAPTLIGEVPSEDHHCLCNEKKRNRQHDEYDDGCEDGYHISHLLCRFIDIDFIEFVLTSHPSPRTATVVDIGVYQAGELLNMAAQGFNVVAFEPNPNRFNACMTEIASHKKETQERIILHNLAVSDSSEPLHFQLAGLDSHAYVVDPGSSTKPKSIVVKSIPISQVVTSDTFFVKIDTQGFDTTILEALITSIQAQHLTVSFIQFEFSPYFEVTRARKTSLDHKKILRRLQDAGYDIYMGAAVQPWAHSHRSQYGKNPLAMLAVAPEVPTCVDDFVDFMHQGRQRHVRSGSTTDIGTWMDILAVKRQKKTVYYRHTGWVLSRKM